MFKPAWDNIMVKDREPVKYTPSGLAIPESHHGDVLFADVVFVGTGPFMRDGKEVSPPCVPDQCVLIHKNSGLVFEVGGEKYRTLPASHIIAVEEKE